MSGDQPARPDLLVAVVGTATEIGKTWTVARVLVELRRHDLNAVARKPAQSFALSEHGSTDADVLARAADEAPIDVCPEHRWYATPMAPPMAADALGRDRIEVAALLAEIRWPAHTAIGLVETVGGVRSPISHDADCAEFVAGLAPDRVVLVADAGLGTINAVRLSLAALDPLLLDEHRVLVFLNRTDGSDLHLRNRAWLEGEDGYETATDIDDVCRWLRAARDAAAAGTDR